MWKKNEKNRWKIVLHCNVLFPLKLSKWHTFQEDLSPEHCHSSQCRPRTLCSKPYPVCREARDLFTDDKSPIYGNLFVIIHNIHTILRIRHTHVHGHIMGLHVFIWRIMRFLGFIFTALAIFFCYDSFTQTGYVVFWLTSHSF